MAMSSRRIILTSLLFSSMMGSIISPGGPPNDHSSPDHSSPVHDHPPEHTPPPAATTTDALAGQAGAPNPSHVPTPPVVDNSLWERIKRSTSSAEPIEKVQKSSMKLYDHLHKYLLQEARKKFPNIEGLKKTEDHIDHGPIAMDSFHELLKNVKAMAEHDIDHTFKHTKGAMKALKEAPHDEDKQTDLRKALVKDTTDNLLGLFPNPLNAAHKFYTWWNSGTEESDGTKKNHDGHEVKEGGHHAEHDGRKLDGHDHNSHLESIEKSADPNHHHLEQKKEKSNPEHKEEHHQGDNVHRKRNQVEQSNPGSHQNVPPSQSSPWESFVETMLYFVPIDKLIRLFFTK